MKKLISITLMLAVCACCFGASAQEPVTKNMPVMGLTFTYPREMADAKGTVGTDGALPVEDGVYYTYLYYAAASPDELAEMLASGSDRLSEVVAPIFYVFAAPGNKDFTAVNALVGNSLHAENAVEIGKADDWTFYLYTEDNEGFGSSGKIPAVYCDEYRSLCGLTDRIRESMTFSVPFNEYSGKMDGTVIRFMATDLEGNPVSSEEIFAQHEITMVNLWATWCGPCVGELGELQKIHTRFQKKDCAVLGLLTADSDPGSAQDLMKENGITYQVVTAPEQFYSYFPYEGVPTSFYVDRNGAFLGTKITGAQTDLYESALEPLLEKVKK